MIVCKYVLHGAFEKSLGPQKHYNKLVVVSMEKVTVMYSGGSFVKQEDDEKAPSGNAAKTRVNTSSFVFVIHIGGKTVKNVVA